MPRSNLRADIDRLWTTLMASAEIGATGRGGLNRLSLNADDGAVRRLFARWCAEAGLSMRIDAMGNMFATRQGRNPAAKAILIGSHLDTQIHGGRFDGILGVLGALEVIRTLNEHGVTTEHPLTIVNWTNEEGARFEPPMMGSKVFAGLAGLAETQAITDRDGVTVGAALDAIGFRGADVVRPEEFDSYFELHIEQGPKLEAEGMQVGVVTGCYDVRGFIAEVRGVNAHAGPTPMPQRRNALVGAAALITAINDIGWAYHATGGTATTARMKVEPNLLGILAHRVEMQCDFRHPVAGVPVDMLASLKARLPEIAARGNCDIEIIREWQFGGIAFDRTQAGLVRQASEALGYRTMDILTVAGHDSMHAGLKMPAAMIFTPCEKGLSHNEAENVTPEMIAPGVNVLLHAVLARDAFMS